MKQLFLKNFYRSLRFRFGLVFGFVFLLLLSVLVLIIYFNIKNTFEDSFDNRLLTEANFILERTSIDPLMIPLPKEGEYFLLTYQIGNRSDTLFNNLPFLPSNWQMYQSKFLKWKSVRSIKPTESDGQIIVIYAYSSEDLIGNIKQLQILLFLFIPFAVLISVIIGYFLSGYLLKPVNYIIKKTSKVSLQNEIELLEMPSTQDELYHLTLAINQMLQRIDLQNKHQHAFFAAASHELRTPLSVMLTELQVLEAAGLPPEIKIMIENQKSAVQGLIKIVNDFLVMAQLKAKKVSTVKTPCDLREMSLDVLQKFQKDAKHKRQSFKVSIFPGDETFIINADSNHLTIAISNLVVNTIKHGLADSLIEIQLKKQNSSIVLQLTNRANINTGNIDELKNEFVRDSSGAEGFGIGLWITDKLIELNEGKLILRYSENTFVAELRWQAT